MDMKKLTREGKEETGSRGPILKRPNMRPASYCLLGLFGLLMLTQMDPHSGASAGNNLLLS